MRSRTPSRLGQAVRLQQPPDASRLSPATAAPHQLNPAVNNGQSAHPATLLTARVGMTRPSTARPGGTSVRRLDDRVQLRPANPEFARRPPGVQPGPQRESAVGRYCDASARVPHRGDHGAGEQQWGLGEPLIEFFLHHFRGTRTSASTRTSRNTDRSVSLAVAGRTGHPPEPGTDAASQSVRCRTNDAAVQARCAVVPYRRVCRYVASTSVRRVTIAAGVLLAAVVAMLALGRHGDRRCGEPRRARRVADEPAGWDPLGALHRHDRRRVSGLPTGHRTQQAHDGEVRRCARPRIGSAPGIATGDIRQAMQQYIDQYTGGDPNTLAQVAVFGFDPVGGAASVGGPESFSAGVVPALDRQLAAGIGSSRVALILQPDMPFALCAPTRAPV